mgnify:CR=1 FL=1
MKKYFFILAAAAALAACAKNEVTPVLSQENTEIAYNVAPKTKALDTTHQENFSTDNVFASWAFYLPKDQTWAANSATSQPYIVNSKISHKNGIWKDQTKSYYWPKDGGSLTFLAYSLNKGDLNLAGEYSAFTCDNADGVQGHIELMDNKNTDFLVAEIAADKTANENQYVFNGVPTLFKHKLSRVACTVKKAADYADKKFELKEINFLKVATYGSYGQIPNDKFTAGTATNDQIYTNAVQEITTTAAAVAAEDVVIYMPQTFADATAKIQVKYTVTTTVGGSTPVVENCVKEISIKDKFAEWAMGKKYTFNITFALDEITWDPAVEKWEDATAADVTIQ